MKTSFNGVMENTVTFEADASLTTPGTLVKLDSSGKVTPCAADDSFIGIALSIRDGLAAVQLTGWCETKLSGSCSLGWQKLSANSADEVQADENGREYLVISAVTGDTVGFIL